MIYATVADLVARFGELEIVQLTDQDHIPPSVINVAAVDVKIADACALADSYIGQVYRLPLAGCAKPVPGAAPEYVVPPVLVRLVCDLTRYYLHDDLAPENEVYRRYQAAMKELEKIATGKSVLSCPWGGSPGVALGADAQTGGDEVYAQFSARAVTEDTLRGFA